MGCHRQLLLAFIQTLLAERYATHIVRLQDGRLISDSNPFPGEEGA